jgi:S-formylglutathione hydrolase
MSLERIRRHRMFGGWQEAWRHSSAATATAMEFAIYLPPAAEAGARLPMLTWLSGLTCTWANFTEKAGAQRYAAEHGLILVVPDTSPRGTDLPGEHDTFDFGSGAGFYIDATRPPWAEHYRMETYVGDELPALIAARFPADLNRQGIFGHSMGGHGALTLAFKRKGAYRSLSALAPIVAPASVPWGRNAFRRYLGPDAALWRAHDACHLVAASGWSSEILIDQGTADEFVDVQLRPELFRDAAEAARVPLRLRLHDGYDHSYYFIASFVGDHLAHHARLLAGP